MHKKFGNKKKKKIKIKLLKIINNFKIKIIFFFFLNSFINFFFILNIKFIIIIIIIIYKYFKNGIFKIKLNRNYQIKLKN